MMKNIVKKLFISALVASVASMAAASAVTINVGNRSSYGILNLDKLLIKNASNTTTAILSGDKIWATYICSGTSLNSWLCKPIDKLWTGTDTHLTNSLTIQWSGTNAVVFTQDSNKTLNIVGSGSTTVSATDGKITIYSSGGTNGNHYEWYNRVTNTSTWVTNATITDNTNTYLNHVENGAKTSSNQIKGTGSVTVSSNNGTIIISGSDNNTTYTAGAGLTLSSTTFKAKLKQESNASISSNSISDRAGKQYAVTPDKSWYLSVNVPRIDNNTTYSPSDGIEFDGTAIKTKLQNYSPYEISATTSTRVAGSISSDKLYPVGLDKSGYLSVYVPRTGGGNGDSERQKRNFWTNWSDFLTPKDNNNIMLHQALYHTWSFDFYSYQWLFTQAASHFTFDAKWIRIGDSAVSIATWAWLSVAWIIAAWSNAKHNYIYMYATWNSTDQDRHYEIMWNSELAIGTKGWAFLYFAQKTWTYVNHYYEYLAWQATNTYTPWSCSAPKSGWDSDGDGLPGRGKTNDGGDDDGWVGTISPGWWGGSDPETCTSSQWNERNSVQLGEIEPVHAYKSLMVWVNTNAPKATLDVNGTIRVWNNCATPDDLSCTDENAWTMMYLENGTKWYLLVCTKITYGSTVTYLWHDLISGAENYSLRDFWFTTNDLECLLPKPAPGPNNNIIQRATSEPNHPLQY